MSNYTANVNGTTQRLVPLGHGVVMILLNVISSIFGSVGNSLVCATIYTTTRLQTVSNYFLVSLAVADLLVTVVAQPLLVAFLGAGLGGSCLDIVELLFRLVGNVMSSSSVLHLCFISVDRSLMVIKPHTFNKIMTRSRCRCMIAFSWILPLIYGVLRLTIDKKVTSLFTVFVMAICYAFIIVSYSQIVYQLRKQQHMMRSRSQTYGVASTLKRKRRDVERSVTMTIGIVIVIFTISWLPIIVLRSVRASDNSGTAYNWARTLSLCNSAVNPWIYCYRIPQFRAGYKRLLILCQWERVKGGSVGDNTIHSESGAPAAIKLNQNKSRPSKQIASAHGKTGSQKNIVANSDSEDGPTTPTKQTFPSECNHDVCDIYSCERENSNADIAMTAGKSAPQ